MSRLLDLERARFAGRRVAEARSRKLLPRYANRTKSAPAEILENGLAQTLAFYREKGDEYGLLATHVLEWLAERGLLPRPSFEALLALPSAPYRRSTEEALELLVWLKRLAAAAAEET